MTHIATFEFHIVDLGGVTQMHIIPLSSLLIYHGFEKEERDTFLFEF